MRRLNGGSRGREELSLMDWPDLERGGSCLADNLCDSDGNPVLNK